MLTERENIMDDCIFCKIAAGYIPSTKVYEDDQVYAFDDLSPQAPIHTLIIPKKHYRDIADDIPSEELGYLFNAVKKVAQIKGIADSGFRTIVNTGFDAGQTVFHLHVHVLGGEVMPFEDKAN